MVSQGVYLLFSVGYVRVPDFLVGVPFRSVGRVELVQRILKGLVVGVVKEDLEGLSLVRGALVFVAPVRKGVL